MFWPAIMIQRGGSTTENLDFLEMQETWKTLFVCMFVCCSSICCFLFKTKKVWEIASEGVKFRLGESPLISEKLLFLGWTPKPTKNVYLPETNSEFTPENGWLEDNPFLLGCRFYTGNHVGSMSKSQVEFFQVELQSVFKAMRWIDSLIFWEETNIIWDVTPLFLTKITRSRCIYNRFLIDLVFSTGKNHQNNMGPPCSVLRILGKVLAELNATPRETFPDLQLVVIRRNRFGWSCFGRFWEFGRVISQAIFVVGFLEWWVRLWLSKIDCFILKDVLSSGIATVFALLFVEDPGSLSFTCQILGQELFQAIVHNILVMYSLQIYAHVQIEKIYIYIYIHTYKHMHVLLTVLGGRILHIPKS